MTRGSMRDDSLMTCGTLRNGCPRPCAPHAAEERVAPSGRRLPAVDLVRPLPGGVRSRARLQERGAVTNGHRVARPRRAAQHARGRAAPQPVQLLGDEPAGGR
jgi:hypothetical protein